MKDIGVMVKKKLLFLIICFSFMFILCGCDKPNKSMILFNKNPITKDNLLTNSSEFLVGKRIYYIFISEERIDSNFIRVRVLKRDEKVNYVATKLLYSNDFRLYKDQVYYYNDYIVMNEAGTYCMLVYAGNNLNGPLAIADFQVKN